MKRKNRQSSALYTIVITNHYERGKNVRVLLQDLEPNHIDAMSSNTWRHTRHVEGDRVGASLAFHY